MDNEVVIEISLPDDLYQEATEYYAKFGLTVEEVAIQFIKNIAKTGKPSFISQGGNQP